VGCFIGGDGEIHSSIKIKYLQNQYHYTQKNIKPKIFSYFVLIQKLAITTGSEFQHFAGFDTALTDSPEEPLSFKGETKWESMYPTYQTKKPPT
jgi:hypothetical protein